MTPVIHTEDLEKRFRGGVEALNGLNLDVSEGSVFGLIGPNGAGKTTTLKILMNIFKSTSGQSELLGVDSRRLGPSDLARIGYVSENQDMPDWMTVDYLLGYLEPFYPTWDRGRASELMVQFGLPPNRKLGQLSRGMRMKVALVSSLAYHPRVLILDEPFSGLDPVVRDDLSEGLVVSAGETTILISSHDLADIESFASHIGYLDNGRLQFSEGMASLIERFREVEVIVDRPATIPPDSEWPTHWLRTEATETVVRFVESQFDRERTPGDIRRLLDGVTSISMNPMPLRSIFVTLARNGSSTA